MATTEAELIQFLRSNPPATKFVPYCHLSKEADALTVYFEGDPDYSKRLSDHITLYLSLETNEPVGCRIKGISGILEDLPNFVRVDHGGVRLSIIFFAFRGGADDDVLNAIKSLSRVADQREMVLEPAL
jgi:hypothetical protein